MSLTAWGIKLLHSLVVRHGGNRLAGEGVSAAVYQKYS